jgi:small GTP-binding protein
VSPDVLKAKIVLVGPPGVGKTSLVRRYVLDAFDDAYRATLGANVYKWTGPVDVDRHPVQVTMTLWDTTGEPGLPEGLRDVYAYGAAGVLAVADASDAASVPALSPWLAGTLRLLGDVPVQVLLNKGDLGPREAAVASALEAARARAAPCYVTSARTGDNVAAAFADLASRIVLRTLVPPDGPVDDEDFVIALVCKEGRTAADIARERGLAVPRVEARLERLRRRGFVRLASLDLDPAGRPRATYAATQTAYLEPLRAAQA